MVIVRSLILAIFAMLVLAFGDSAAANETNPSERRFYASVGTGFDFNRGDYGERDANDKALNTNTISIPLFTKLEWDPVTFRTSVSLLYIDGSDLISGGGNQRNQNAVAQERTSFGVGDVTTSLTYTYYPKRESPLPIIDLIAKVKIHTAAPADLGGSGTDLTLGTELAKTFGIVSVFGGAGYRLKTGKDFDNVWLASLGGTIKITKWLSIGGAYDFRQAATSSSTDSHEVSPSLSLRVSEHVRLSPYGVIGLSDGAPNWGFGTSVSYNF